MWPTEQFEFETPGLESDSARNNIQQNNKQKPEITNKNTGKRTNQNSQKKS